MKTLVVLKDIDKMDVNFAMSLVRTVDEMILSLPKIEMVIVKHLRNLVVECLPQAIEKPYYGLGAPPRQIQSKRCATIK
jgi:hypothetical protein